MTNNKAQSATDIDVGTRALFERDDFDESRLMVDQVLRSDYLDNETYIQFGVLTAAAVDEMSRKELDTDLTSADRSDISTATWKKIEEVIESAKREAVEEFAKEIKQDLGLNHTAQPGYDHLSVVSLGHWVGEKMEVVIDRLTDSYCSKPTPQGEKGE